MFRVLSGCTVFYPSDAVSTENATRLAASVDGLCYIRTTNPEVPVIYDDSEEFQIGQAKVTINAGLSSQYQE